MIQPDITNCGGLSEAKKICDLAHIYDVRVQCHVAGTPIAEAAAIQLEAAIPNFTSTKPTIWQRILTVCPTESTLTYRKTVI